MIQAYLNPDVYGLYDRVEDELDPGTDQRYEDRVRSDIFYDFDLASVPHYQQCKERWPGLDPEREAGAILFRRPSVTDAEAPTRMHLRSICLCIALASKKVTWCRLFSTQKYSSLCHRISRILRGLRGYW